MSLVNMESTQSARIGLKLSIVFPGIINRGNDVECQS